ncbi:glycoside hydrolase family 3 protein [Microbacterium sp. B2969]|uniref:Glycoside hydrolase family 3 protein n=1 Tax=Microbacterium alkaliflavum TaxID=3248839 RepID=A0ABW7QE68_9MICO
MDAAVPAHHRATLLLEAMSLEEKVDLMTGDVLEGVEGFSNAGIDRLGIPPLRMADAGSGLRRPPGYSAATALPSPLAITASWDRDLVDLHGRVLGEECYLLRHNVVLGPNADLARVPWWGRIGESVGEDPYLGAEMTRGAPAAIQRPGVMVTYKHPLVYNQETNRGGGQNSIVDERTIREVYGPPFHAAVQGGAVSMMSSFNRINGVYACENDDMQNKLLRDAYGFAGFLMADYLANHSLSPGNGLDMETPGLPIQPTFYAGNLLWAVQTGSISEAVVDRAVGRILWAMFTTGLFDAPLPDADLPVPYAEHAVIARQIEEAAITLLKNDAGVLPFGADVRSIAVIGADADIPSRLGGASYVTIPADSVGILQGLVNRAPDGVDVRWAPGADRLTSGDGIFVGGLPIPSAFTAERGVHTVYYGSDDLTSEVLGDRVDPDATYNVFGVINEFNDAVRLVVPQGTRSLRAETHLIVPVTGEYSFTLAGWGDARLWFDDVEVAHLDSPGIQGLVAMGPWTLEAGATHTIRLAFRVTEGRVGGLEPGAVQLGWTPPATVVHPDVVAAADLARESDVAVVWVRSRESEQQDSATLTLPRDQDALVRAVAAANPNTVVVLGTGLPALMPWTDDVPAIVHSYFGGQEQGHAVARVLFGDVNPSGKLPYTIARSEDQYDAIGISNPVRDERNLDVHYGEGLDIGYRGFERHGLQPRFAFGHGLSFTRFHYDSITVEPPLSDGTEPIRMRFTLTNVGDRAGAEVAQAYLAVPEGHGEPLKKLVGFEKVPLEPGESRDVEITLDPRDALHPLAYWDTAARLWRTISGTYTVHVGTSSQQLPLHATFRIQAKEGPGVGQGGTAYPYATKAQGEPTFA